MRRAFAFPAILLLLFLLCLSCKEGENIASGGAHLLLTADPQQIGFNGTSSLTVTGTDDNGVPLPDGTLVSFHVEEAGSVSPNSVKLLGGTATSTYHATFVSGDITITVTSGGVAATTTITVADDIQQNVFVSANPATFSAGGGTSVISAVVTDGSGKPIQDKGVQFSTTEGTLQSGGASIQTNSNGVVSDVLNTTASATVTATTDDGFSEQTTVLVGIGKIVCHMSLSTSSPTVGQTVSFFDTSDDPGNQIARYHWDFGDNASADGQNARHAYASEGTFDVAHSVTDVRANTTTCDPVPIQITR